MLQKWLINWSLSIMAPSIGALDCRIHRAFLIFWIVCFVMYHRNYLEFFVIKYLYSNSWGSSLITWSYQFFIVVLTFFQSERNKQKKKKSFKGYDATQGFLKRIQLCNKTKTKLSVNTQQFMFHACFCISYHHGKQDMGAAEKENANLPSSWNSF